MLKFAGRAGVLRARATCCTASTWRWTAARSSGCWGANGVGKSTTLKAIMGLVPVQSGSISFAGHDLHRQKPYRIPRLGIGYVPEDRRIFPRLTVLDNLRTGFRPPGRFRRAHGSVARTSVCQLSAPQGARAATRRHPPLRRRAADAGHRPRHDARPTDRPCWTSPPRASCRVWWGKFERLSMSCAGPMCRFCWWSRTCP